MQNLFAKMYFGEQCGQKNCTQGRDAVNFSFLGLPCICDLGGQGCKGNGSRWKGPFAWEVLQGLIAQSLKYVFRSDLWLSYMNRRKKNKYDHLRNTSYWGKKLAAKPCLRPLKTSRRAVITTNFGWHVDVKHWKQIHENNTLFVHWRIRVISHAKLGGWCLPQWGFMTEYGKSIPKTRNQFVVTPDTVLPCPWVWINSVSKEVANLTMFLDTIMEMNMVRTVLYFLPSIVRNKICNK